VAQPLGGPHTRVLISRTLHASDGRERRQQSPRPGEWRKQAACRDHPELRWYRCSHEPLDRDAIAMCGCCPVRIECLAYAVEAHDPAGTWGGVEFPSQH
jgi:Transcription factor WhiB